MLIVLCADAHRSPIAFVGRRFSPGSESVFIEAKCHPISCSLKLFAADHPEAWKGVWHLLSKTSGDLYQLPADSLQKDI